MIKKTLAMSFGALLLAGNYAMAEQLPLQISVEANIPSDNFYVIPVGNWGADVQKMSWQPASKSLDTLRKSVDMKSAAGAIHGYLEQPASLFNGKDSIVITVNIADKPLAVGRDKKVEVMSDADAKAGKRVSIEFVPTKPVDGYKPGAYNGVVSMMFESVAPGG